MSDPALGLLMLGGMHFFNLLLFTKLRKRANLATMPPPVPPMLRVNAQVAQLS